LSENDPNLVRNQHQIPERVRLVDLDNTYIASRQEVLARIRETDLDLYRLNGDASPPVYKLLDYGRFRFDQQKKKREQQKKLRELNRPIKEFKFKPGIDEHDVGVKVHHIRENLAQHDVKIFMDLKRNAFVLTNRWSRSIADAVSDDGFVLKRILAELQNDVQPVKLTITENQVFAVLKRAAEPATPVAA
jgi:translation initiation factor IF-3